MRLKQRHQAIEEYLARRNFVSVPELADLCGVSEITVRRDLIQLEQQGSIRRVHGGAVARQAVQAGQTLPRRTRTIADEPFLERLDAVVVTSPLPRYESLFRSARRKRRPCVVAESLPSPFADTYVAADDYQAGIDGGRWTGEYIRTHWGRQAFVLDLTYPIANTQKRSKGFLDGLTQVAPDTELVLSINAQSRFETAYQLTRDAFNVHGQINVIFAINDTTAWGAIQACKDLGVDPERCIVVSSGLEGDTIKDAIMASNYCRVGLAMFPEIIGPICAEAAIRLYNDQELPAELVTPHAILHRDNLAHYYERTDYGWQLRWGKAAADLPLPFDLDLKRSAIPGRLPKRLGFIVGFIEHEWYDTMAAAMQTYVGRLGIDLEIIDADEGIKGEIELCRTEIAHSAAAEIAEGDVILIDGGPVAEALATELLNLGGITVVTNALAVLEILQANDKLILIGLGGALRPGSRVFVGPTAEAMLKELRINKLFMMATGLSLSFGLSHAIISEVTIKQAMIRAAREIVVLADHTCFGREELIQVAPLSAIHKIITDDALPASVRLELSKQGIQVVLASM